MSENFPFDTADEFLAAFAKPRRKAKPVTDVDVRPDAAIHVPVMPDKTPLQSQARLTAGVLLGAALTFDDRWLQLACIVGAFGIEVMRLYTDCKLRGYRNARIGDENIAAMTAAAQVKSTALENQPE